MLLDNVKCTIGVQWRRVVATQGEKRLRAPLAAVGSNIEMKVDARVLVRVVVLALCGVG